MDDPWANTWGEPDKPSRDETLTTLPWTSPVHSNEQEADMGMPSWSTGVDVKWAEPSDTHGSLWSQPVETEHIWGSSPYETIPIGSNASLPAPGASSPGDVPVTNSYFPKASPEPSVSRTPSPAETPSPEVREQRITTPTPPASPVSAPASSSRPVSPDNFGSFEAGIQFDETPASLEVDPWTPQTADFVAPAAQGPEWGSSEWDTHDAGEADVVKKTAEEEASDEWEAAKRMKEKQDRVIPPELLASILRQCDELSQDLWPASEGPEEKQDDWRNDWRSGMEGVPNLATLSSKYAPEGMSLPPPVQFGKAAVGKSMAESLKLTRHIPLTRSSPMAVYLASKGSTAWETSVKNRPVVKQDDLPAGWKLPEQEMEATSSSSSDTAKGRKAGLLSFWGRRSSGSPSLDSKTNHSQSPVQKSSSAAGSPRASIDGARPPSVMKPTLSPIHAPPASTSDVPLAISSPPIVVQSPGSQAQSPQLDLPIASSEPAAPSAVSRFFNRFSRTSKGGPSDKRNSISLSGDDLEFLADVPSMNDGDDEDNDAQLRALSSMIGSSPVPPTKLPAPLAPPPPPPPRVPISPPSQRVQSNGLSGLGVFDLPDTSISTSTRSPMVDPMSPTSILTPTSSGFPSRAQTPLARLASPPLPTPTGNIAVLSAPPSSRSHTPILSPPPKSIIPAALPPPPSGPSRVVKSPPLPSATLFDDDDFSDFHSSAVASSSSTSAFDDFSDFSAPSAIPPSMRSHQKIESYDSTFSSASSDRDLFGASQSQNILRSQSQASQSAFDFDDFMSPSSNSSILRSPSPPRPPSKSSKPLHISSRHAPSLSSSSFLRTMASSPSPPPSIPPPLRSVPTPPPPSQHGRKPSVDPSAHGRTVELLEHAAARPGRWPAPPSPLPQTLSPPPPPPRTTSNSIDLFGDFEEPLPPPPRNGANGGIVVGMQPRVLSPPQPSQSFFPSPAPSPAPPAQGAGTKGGLSAQDLSFFEGL